MFDNEDDSSGLDSSSLWGGVFSAASSLGTTALMLNSNPVNEAIYSGQSVNTPNLQTATNFQSGMSMTTILLIVVAVIVGIFAFEKV